MIQTLPCSKRVHTVSANDCQFVNTDILNVRPDDHSLSFDQKIQTFLSPWQRLKPAQNAHCLCSQTFGHSRVAFFTCLWPSIWWATWKAIRRCAHSPFLKHSPAHCCLQCTPGSISTWRPMWQTLSRLVWRSGLRPAWERQKFTSPLALHKMKKVARTVSVNFQFLPGFVWWQEVPKWRCVERIIEPARATRRKRDRKLACQWRAWAHCLTMPMRQYENVWPIAYCQFVIWQHGFECQVVICIKG